MVAVAREGDPGIHNLGTGHESDPGFIVSGASGVNNDNLPLAVSGGSYFCSKHGYQSLISSTFRCYCNGQPVILYGDFATCGARISGASSDLNVN